MSPPLLPSCSRRRSSSDPSGPTSRRCRNSRGRRRRLRPSRGSSRLPAEVAGKRSLSRSGGFTAEDLEAELGLMAYELGEGRLDEEEEQGRRWLDHLNAVVDGGTVSACGRLQGQAPRPGDERGLEVRRRLGQGRRRAAAPRAGKAGGRAGYQSAGGCTTSAVTRPTATRTPATTGLRCRLRPRGKEGKREAAMPVRPAASHVAASVLGGKIYALGQGDSRP